MTAAEKGPHRSGEAGLLLVVPEMLGQITATYDDVAWVGTGGESRHHDHLEGLVGVGRDVIAGPAWTHTTYAAAPEHFGAGGTGPDGPGIEEGGGT
ncbi:hypothetical protein MLP_29530 [Microlunatus phosphovorus NM-1]|uniref:Uncharacterized protein n=1 Tax=Microlunatus phosphovorus (strain ATCC 700054 / DSM 10555 / JCM 9379 / NBRC 101784 / NCIMB 13414 / VKM Ac-1990 / NM-1) TaxID=1032480 RepID=F5XJR7_MICPN|nr:hypothetical protein MLP_29530 [Microlunatus phosphovorus NM-1]